MTARSRPTDDAPAVAERGHAILDELERAVVGKRDVLAQALLALLAGGHLLLEDNPGVAKTLIARSLATVTGLRFTRVQFTPDLLPADITGSSVYDRTAADFVFRPGPIFTHVLLGDEINRAPPKTQAALLEAMEEGQVTTETGTRRLDPPFVAVATQNPIEYEGTYPLPEAQLDRFLLRLAVGYPTVADERDLLARRAERGTESVGLAAVVDRATTLTMQQTVERIRVDPAVVGYIVDLVAATRAHPALQVGASPRGGLALLRLSRARAALEGRPFVVPDDVKEVAVAALAHRLVLAPEHWMERGRAEAVVREVLAEVPAPPERG